MFPQSTSRFMVDSIVEDSAPDRQILSHTDRRSLAVVFEQPLYLRTS